MKLESKKVVVEQSAEYLFNELQDINNFEKLMPENTTTFEVLDENCFEFGLKGLPTIKLLKKSATSNTEIVLGAASSKLPFTMQTKLNEIDANKTEIQLFFEGDFNPMMSMMIKAPISKFIEAIASNMNKL